MRPFEPTHHHLLHNRSFLALWLGLLISSVGDWINYVAMVALVFNQTGSAGTLAGLRLMHIVPILLVAPFAGVFVDRWRRKTTLVVSSAVSGVAIACLAVYHPVAVVFLAYGLITLSSTFFNPARTAVLPDIVRPEDLVAANSLSQITQTASILVGGVLGGLVVAGAGPATAFWLDAISFGVVSCLAATIPLHEARVRVRASSVRNELGEGIAYLRTQPLVGIIVTAGALFVFAPATVLTIGIAFAREILHSGSSGYGVILAGMGIGSALGAGFMIAYRSRIREDVTFAASGIALGLAVAALGVSRSVPLAALAYGASGFASMVNTVSGVTLLQRLVPVDIRGRIFAVSSTFDHLGAFVSTVGIGLGAGFLDAAGLITTSGLAAATTGLIAFVTVWLSGNRQRAHSS